MTLHASALSMLVLWGSFLSNGNGQLTPSTGCRFNDGKCMYDINLRDCAHMPSSAIQFSKKDVQTNRDNIAQLKLKWVDLKSDLTKSAAAVQRLQIVSAVKEQELRSQNAKITDLQKELIQLQLELDYVRRDSPYVQENIDLKRENERLKNEIGRLHSERGVIEDKYNKSKSRIQEMSLKNRNLEMLLAGNHTELNSTAGEICLRVACNDTDYRAKSLQSHLSSCVSESREHQRTALAKTVQVHALERQLLTSERNNDLCQGSLNSTTTDMLKSQQQLRITSASLQHITREKTTTDIKLNMCEESVGKLAKELSTQEALKRKLMTNNEELKKQLGICISSPPKVPRTCQEWQDLGYKKKTEYMIDPDGVVGVDPFMVECEIATAGKSAATVIHHKNEGRTNMRAFSCTSPQCKSLTPMYLASISQIVALINISTDCKQHIKYECAYSPLQLGNTHSPTYGSWYSRDGLPMRYWGGAAPGSGMCACGMSRSCYSSSLNCNCDHQSHVWKTDEGYLTDRSTLPIGSVRVGGTGSSSQGFLTVGAMRCYTNQ